MKHFGLAVAALSVLVAGCTASSTSSSSTAAEDLSASTSTVPTNLNPTTTTTTFTTLPLREPDEPPEYTDFEYTTSCDPTAEDANLQVIQAFVVAYNERDEDRLRELVSDSVTVADMSGIPHLGEDDWNGVTRWAELGWSADDAFELIRLVMYDSGSVFEVERSNDILRTNGIESLSHSWKVHSSKCVISHMVLYLPSEGLGESECRYWESFINVIVEGTTQSVSEPEACSK